MGEHSSIEWTHHTLNLWWGCVHISPACDHCYADAWAHHSLPPGWLIVGEEPHDAPAHATGRPEPAGNLGR